MKTTLLLLILFFSLLVLASEVPDGCPTEDANLNAAVANGQKIACQISYFVGHGAQMVQRPITPNAKYSIELACIDAQEEACPGIVACYESPYYKCVAQ